MSHTHAVRRDPRVADWNHLPEEVVMIINNFIRKMDYDDRWGWGESIARGTKMAAWNTNQVAADMVDMVKTYFIYRLQMLSDPVALCLYSHSNRKQLLADIISVHFDRAYKHAVGSGINELELAWDMV